MRLAATACVLLVAVSAGDAQAPSPHDPLAPRTKGRPDAPVTVAYSPDIPPETLSLLRYGRGVDTSRYQEAGYRYRYTTPQAVEAFAQRLRLERAVGKESEYRYERDVESFFRGSPAIVRNEE